MVEKSQLCELNPGVVDGLSAEEIKTLYPDEFERAQREPYGARYPRAESYHDLCVRIEPIIMELERSTGDILIVAQASVLRVLLGYLQGCSPLEIPLIDVPEGELMEITPMAYGMQTKSYRFWDPVARRNVRDQLWVQQFGSSRATTPSRYRSTVSSPYLAPLNASTRAGINSRLLASPQPARSTTSTSTIPPLHLPDRIKVDKAVA